LTAISRRKFDADDADLCGLWCRMEPARWSLIRTVRKRARAGGIRYVLESSKDLLGRFFYHVAVVRPGTPLKPQGRV